MKGLDRDTMDLLGYFFVEIGLMPKAWASRFGAELELHPEDYRGPTVVWWSDHQPTINIQRYSDFRWTRGHPTGWYLRDDVEEISWSDENNHRVEMVQDKRERPVDLTVLLDIRKPYSDFVDQVVEMARTASCTFFDFEQQVIVEPSREWVLKKIREHEMNHVVFDSSGKLAPN